MQTKAQQLLKQQLRLKQKAKEIERNLMNLKQQKLQSFRKQLKAELAQNIQIKYEQFKNNFENYFNEQLQSLNLEKQIKKNQVLELQQRITLAISELKSNKTKLKNLKINLQQSAQEAIEHVHLNMQLEIKAIKEQKEKELSQKLSEYEELVYIE